VPVDVELEPGQMVIFDVYTIHGAAHNHEDFRSIRARTAKNDRRLTEPLDVFRWLPLTRRFRQLATILWLSCRVEIG
jgi:ectoine hydroxylase-related dioxygenase (phytanoyl-CoA dioxygenase family)